MMRIALISDIHGNAVALEAILADIRAAGVDRIVCLGDVVTLGPDPRSVMDLLHELDCPCVQGNHDEFMLVPEQAHGYITATELLDSLAWCREQLTTDDLDRIRSFEPTLEVSLPGEHRLLAFHGTPRSNTQDLLSTTPSERVDELLAGFSAPVMASGHTHLVMLRRHRGNLLVNPGSVGMPFRDFVGGATPALLDHAEYALLDANETGITAIDFRQVHVGRERQRAAVEASTNPLRGYFLGQYG